MTTREVLHRLIDQLPEAQAEHLLVALQSSARTLNAVALAPEDDEPGIDGERMGLAEARVASDGAGLSEQGDGVPGWLLPALRQMVQVLELSPNWNSHGARTVEPAAVYSALKILLQTTRADTPVPRVVPTPHGGIHLEWNTRGIDLEVEPLPDGRVYVYYEDARTGTEWERELRSDLAPLTKALVELSSRS